MKLIICIFEGISYPLINDYIGHDLLPNFKMLCNNGSYGELVCDSIPYEASCLTTAFSGNGVKQHGIISYWNPRCNDYIPRLWDSENIKNYMFWNQDHYKDYRYTLINLFGTQPTYNINGTMLSYSMEKNLRFSYPNNLLYTLNKRRLPYVQDISAFYTKDSVKSEFCKNILEIDFLRKNVFLELLKDDIDIAIVNFTQIDRFSHFYFNETSESRLADSTLYQAYKQSDNFLGEIFSIVDKYNSELLVFSEIGFGYLKKFVDINNYLLNKNLLKKDSITQKILYDKPCIRSSSRYSRNQHQQKRRFCQGDN